MACAGGPPALSPLPAPCQLSPARRQRSVGKTAGSPWWPVRRGAARTPSRPTGPKQRAWPAGRGGRETGRHGCRTHVRRAWSLSYVPARCTCACYASPCSVGATNVPATYGNRTRAGCRRPFPRPHPRGRPTPLLTAEDVFGHASEWAHVIPALLASLLCRLPAPAAQEGGWGAWPQLSYSSRRRRQQLLRLDWKLECCTVVQICHRACMASQTGQHLAAKSWPPAIARPQLNFGKGAPTRPSSRPAPHAATIPGLLTGLFSNPWHL